MKGKDFGVSFLFRGGLSKLGMYFQFSKSLTLLQLHTERTFRAFLPAVSTHFSFTRALRMLMTIAPR